MIRLSSVAHRTLTRKNAGFWTPVRATAWDFLDRPEIGPRPEWVRVGQVMESGNGRLRVTISRIDEGSEATRLWLDWDDPNAPQGPHAWLLDFACEYWRPVLPDKSV